MASANLDALVPAWFACRRLRITQQTLNYWRSTGKLVPANRDGGGRPQYRYRDVLAAEQQTRESPNSRRGCRHHTAAPEPA